MGFRLGKIPKRFRLVKFAAMTFPINYFAFVDARIKIIRPKEKARIVRFSFNSIHFAALKIFNRSSYDMWPLCAIKLERTMCKGLLGLVKIKCALTVSFETMGFTMVWGFCCYAETRFLFHLQTAINYLRAVHKVPFKSMQISAFINV